MSSIDSYRREEYPKDRKGRDPKIKKEVGIILRKFFGARKYESEGQKRLDSLVVEMLNAERPDYPSDRGGQY